MEEYIKLIENKQLTREDFLPMWEKFKKELNTGKIRVAVKQR